MFGHQSNDRNKQLCCRSNSTVFGHSDHPYQLPQACTTSTECCRWLVIMLLQFVQHLLEADLLSPAIWLMVHVAVATAGV